MNNKKSSSPQVTVMVSNYNTERYLAAALESLRIQTFRNFEVLIIDDASTDGSFDIINRYVESDDRFRLIRLPHNHGLTYVRVVGLAEARGDYIAILDSDDIATANRLEQQVAYLERHPEVVLVGSYYGVITAENKIHRRLKRVPTSDAEIRWRLTFGTCFIHSTIMYRKKQAVECGGYDLDIKRGEDIDLYAKIIAHGKLAAIPKKLAYWRWHKESMTQALATAELEKYSFKVAQKSIKLNLGLDVDLDTAASAFFNSSTPAQSKKVFLQSLEVVFSAFKQFCAKAEKKEYYVICKCYMLHLFKLYKSNKKQTWWPSAYNDWLSDFKRLLQTYKWWTDYRLLVSPAKLSSRHFFLLIYITLCKSSSTKREQKGKNHAVC